MPLEHIRIRSETAVWTFYPNGGYDHEPLEWREPKVSHRDRAQREFKHRQELNNFMLPLSRMTGESRQVKRAKMLKQRVQEFIDFEHRLYAETRLAAHKPLKSRHWIRYLAQHIWWRTKDRRSRRTVLHR